MRAIIRNHFGIWNFEKPSVVLDSARATIAQLVERSRNQTYDIMILITYILYLHASAWLTFWVGHSLHKNGRYFLVEAFADEGIADAINKLLLVGFYLVNFAYVLFVLKEKQDIVGMAGVIEVVSSKVGLIAFTLAVMHFFNLFMFAIVRQYRMGELKHRFLYRIIHKIAGYK